MRDEYRDDLTGNEASQDDTVIDASSQRRARLQKIKTAEQKNAVGVKFLEDIPLELNVILAEATMAIKDIIALETDSIVQLDKVSGDPVDIYLEDQELGKGEVIVLHEKLRIRVTEISPESREEKKEETSETDDQ